MSIDIGEGAVRNSIVKLPDAESFNPICAAVWGAGGAIGITDDPTEMRILMFATVTDAVIAAYSAALAVEKQRIAEATGTPKGDGM